MVFLSVIGLYTILAFLSVIGLYTILAFLGAIGRVQLVKMWSYSLY